MTFVFMLNNWFSCSLLFTCWLGKTKLMNSYILTVAWDKTVSLRSGYYFIQYVFFFPIHRQYKERWQCHIPFLFIRMSYVAHLFIRTHIWVKNEILRTSEKQEEKRECNRATEEKRECNKIIFIIILPNQIYHSPCPNLFEYVCARACVCNNFL